MTDYYLEDKTRLQGQPKRVIANYVESQGILVPRIFESLAEARKSKKAIILRSEHEQDYDGVSGIWRSPKLSGKYPSLKGINNLDEAKKRILEYENQYGAPLFAQYCRLLGVNPEKFIEDTSFSIWQYLPGLNRTVSADSAISGRYHILSFDSRSEKQSARSYFIWDNGKLKVLYSWKIPEDESDTRRLIEDYENIRHLDKFNPDHCPIMEFQTVGKKNYFLQYHRGRDFEPATFTLDRAVESGETELLLVRGATAPIGLNLKMTMALARWFSEKEEKLPDAEDSALSNEKFAYDKIMFRKRKFQPFHSENFEWTCNKIAAEHYAKESMFKPEISGIVPIEALISHPDSREMHKLAHETGQDQFKNFYLISDGRRAFIKSII